MLHTNRIRRGPARRLALAASFVLLASACTGDGAETSTSGDVASSTTSAPPTSVTTPGDTSTTQPVDTGRPYGGEIVVADTQEPPTLNPLIIGGRDPIVSLIGNGYLAGAWRIDGATRELVPHVVTELPSIANGGWELVVKEGDETNPFTGEVFEGVPDTDLVVRYQIDEEAVWEDGTPISGEDFLFTYETIVDPEHPTVKPPYDTIVHPAGAAWCETQLQAAIEAAEEAAAAEGTEPEEEEPEEESEEDGLSCLPADEIENSFLIGDKSVEFTMWRPAIGAELMFDVLVPKHQVEGTDFVEAWNDTPWYSAGPFKFDAWSKGDQIRLVRNENYWGTDPTTGQQLPFLDAVVFRFIPESTSLMNAFAAREVHVINPDPTENAIERLQRLASEGAQFEVGMGRIWEHLVFSFSDVGRLERNPDSLMVRDKLRQALALATDRESIAEEILLGQGDPLSSYLDVFLPRLSTGAWDRKYPHDPEAAASLIQELCRDLRRDCQANPITVVFTTTSGIESRVTLAELLSEFFTPLGIDFQVEFEDGTVYYGETTVNGRFDLGAWAWPASPGLSGLISAHGRWDPDAQPPNGDNFYFWGTPDGYQDGLTAEFAGLVDDLNSTVDAAEVAELVGRAEEILSDALVFLPLYAHLDVGAAWADTVGGVHHDPLQGITWNMGEWYLVDG